MVVQTLDDGAFRFVRPDGQAFDSPVPSSGGADVVVANESADIRITPSTAVTHWIGETLDLDLAVGWLMQKAAREKNVSAET